MLGAENVAAYVDGEEFFVVFGCYVGEWAGFGAPEDYTFTSISYGFDGGAYLLYGAFGGDFTGEYTEVGYGFAVMGLDLSLAVIHSNNLILSGDNPGADYTLVFGVTRAFEIGGN